MGQSRTNRRAAKIGWEKILLADPIADPVARIRFCLHKEFRAAEIRFFLHKEFRAAGIRIGALLMKMAVFLKTRDSSNAARLLVEGCV